MVLTKFLVQTLGINRCGYQTTLQMPYEGTERKRSEPMKYQISTDSNEKRCWSDRIQIKN